MVAVLPDCNSHNYWRIGRDGFENIHTHTLIPDETMPQVFGRLEIDFTRQLAALDGRDVELTTNEFAALALLAATPGKVFDRDQILQELRGIDCDAFNRSVDITMSRLRQKLNDNPKNPVFIKTVWGTGYAFIGETSQDAKKLAE